MRLGLGRARDPLLPHDHNNYAESDTILVRKKTAEGWSGPVIVSDYFGVNYQPVLAEDSRGNIIAVWTSRRGGKYALHWRRVGQNLSLGSELKILPAGKLESDPAILSDSQGKLWLAAQSYRRGSMDIVFYAFEGSGWRQMPAAAATPAPEFRPKLAVGRGGSIWAVWDVYENGKYRVKLSRFDTAAKRWDPPRNVPGDGRLDAYAPDVTVDSGGRVWVACARSSVEEAAYGLRGPKEGRAPLPTIRLVVWDDESWSHPSALIGEEPGHIASGDLPRVEHGRQGEIWVAWQRLFRHVDWKIGLATYSGGSWAGPEVFGRDEPIPLDGPPRKADQHPRLVIPREGPPVVAYQRGRGTFRNRDIHERRIKTPRLRTSEPKLSRFQPEQLQPVERAARPAPDREPVFDSAGNRRRLLFGDLHNHLLVDDGHQGSVDQLFVIHRDRYSSDFAATTSHGDSNKLLISELAHNDALTEALYKDNEFVTIPGFEWTQGDFVVPRAGHRHAIYETPGGPLYRPTEGHSDSIREFSDLMSKTNGLIFAHHITRAYTAGTDWSYVNTRVEPAAEMCSSWGRFEYYQNPGHIRGAEIKNASMQDVWKMGHRIGVIGGSDGHNLYGDRIQGLTGVYAEAHTRPAIFDAIRKRRCYATTGEPIQLDFRVNGHFMGAEIEAASGPVIEGQVSGAANLIAVEIVKYTAGDPIPFPVVYKASVEGPRAKIWWRDPDFTANSLYYLRVTQQLAPALATRYKDQPGSRFPAEMAWSSPRVGKQNQSVSWRRRNRRANESLQRAPRCRRAAKSTTREVQTARL